VIRGEEEMHEQRSSVGVSSVVGEGREEVVDLGDSLSVRSWVDKSTIEDERGIHGQRGSHCLQQ
jgi:hypothetical protein